MTPRSTAATRRRTAKVLQRATGRLATAATARMDSDMPWFRDLSAQDRSWVGMIVQAGIREFLEWYAAGADSSSAKPDLAASMFGEAPRALTGVITLRQTVDLIRLSIEVVEANVDDLVDAADAHDVHDAISRYAREIAFASAEVYARAAEQRGAWDARLEALVVDAVLRAETDEAVLSRASALGWDAAQPLSVVLGATSARPADAAALDSLFEEVRRRARTQGLEALCAVQGDRLVVLLGGVKDARDAAAAIADLFGNGPVVAGPVADGLADAQRSARAALASYRAAPGWPEAPRPALSQEFLPERVLAGDGHARRHLVEEVYRPLVDARSTLIETLAAYFASGGSLEATGRALFVHTNTVRYRLRQVAELTGYSPADPRDALALRIALILGRQSTRAL
ncbi:helix-turn-helix domain-containing protein [Nocardioides sp. KR10-350]|uniref:PucR family transcriptional regulator n=1 Tax=Nocardioides cheoyonin TaxID=3156615 RepID=UPI0032B3EE3C